MRIAIIAALAILSIATAPAFAKGGGWGGYRAPSYKAPSYKVPSYSGGGYTNPHVDRVRSYTKRDGTVVESYHRTHENSTMRDNFSSVGNVNPYTGRVGNVNPRH